MFKCFTVKNVLSVLLVVTFAASVLSVLWGVFGEAFVDKAVFQGIFLFAICWWMFIVTSLAYYKLDGDNDKKDFLLGAMNLFWIIELSILFLGVLFKLAFL